MKILLLSNLYPPFQIGGYEIACKNVVDALRKLGHEILVLTTPSHIPELNSEIKIETHILRLLQLNKFHPVVSPAENVREFVNLQAMVSDFTNTSILLDTIKNFQPDCVYCFNLEGIGGLALLDALNNLNFPWVLHLMDKLPYNLQAGFSTSILSLYNANHNLLYRSGRIITLCHSLIDQIERLTRFSLVENYDVIPGWIDIHEPILKRKYCDQNKIKFVTASRIMPEKGFDLIFEAITLLKSAGFNNFTLDIYGDGEITTYVQLAKQLNITDKISFLGIRTQSQLIESYKSADVFLFPTWEIEPFGFAPIEAMAVGCVPMITANCGAAERLIDELHCIKIQRNVQSLYDAMKSVLQHEINLERLGYFGQILARQDLSFSYCLTKINDVIKEVVQSSGNKQTPSWKDTNLAYLKHNLANKFLFGETR